MKQHIEDLVATFNEQICNYRPGIHLDENLIELRVKQKKEEIGEIEEAFKEEDKIKIIDGLIDLIYFSIGTLHIMGVDRDLFNACFTAVHLANMGKRGGIKEERRIPGIPDEKHPMDAVKPHGWIDPEYVLEVMLSDRERI